MTKKDLIKFLEPFDDEIRIITNDSERGVDNSEVEYKIFNGEKDFFNRMELKNLGFTDGDRYIEII